MCVHWYPEHCAQVDVSSVHEVILFACEVVQYCIFDVAAVVSQYASCGFHTIKDRVQTMNFIHSLPVWSLVSQTSESGQLLPIPMMPLFGLCTCKMKASVWIPNLSKHVSISLLSSPGGYICFVASSKSLWGLDCEKIMHMRNISLMSYTSQSHVFPPACVNHSRPTFQIKSPCPHMILGAMSERKRPWKCREALHGLTLKQWDIAFSIYVWTDLKTKVALDYCLMNGAGDADKCKAVLERRYLAESIETINDIQDAGHDWMGTRAWMQGWLVEYSLNKWIQRMNDKAGVAPSFASVWEKYTALRAKKALPPEGYNKEKARNTWVRRFMSRWACVRRSLMTHETGCSTEVVTQVFRHENEVTSISY